MLQNQAKVKQSSQISAKAAKESKALATRLLDSVKKTGTKNITITQAELNGLVALVHRAEPKVHANVELKSTYAEFTASLETALPALFKYINVSVQVLPSQRGIAIEQVNIGHLHMSGDTFLYITRLMTNILMQKGLFEKLESVVEEVQIDERKITVNMALNKITSDNSEQKSLLMAIRDKLSLFGDPKHVSFYYQHVADLAETLPSKSSVAVFVRHVFSIAQQQTMSNANASAVEENQAALMALAIYLGADRFELMVGDIINWEYKHLVLRNRTRLSATLRGRNDLQKHFIYSTALQLFSNVGASDAIGEYKEFLDTNEGGSGFSFADLQADRAGTRLATIVTSNETVAKKAQIILSTITDEQLLPSIDGLQEGLDEQSFQAEFENANSIKYRETLKIIDNNLKTLPIYQLGW